MKKSSHPVPMPGGGLLLQYRLHPGVKTVETSAHIQRFEGHENPRGRRQAQHGRCRACITEPIHWALAAGLNRTAIPMGRRTSAAHLSTGGVALVSLIS